MSSTDNQLLESAKFFAAEAIRNALDANAKDASRWPLALLHVVTSLEHAAKALLAKQHPIFVREKMDADDRSVGLQSAFQRLQVREIYGLHVSDKDRKRVASAIKIRNGIAHGLNTSNPSATEAKFFEVFAYLRDFFQFHLNIKVLDLVDPSSAGQLLSIGKQIQEIEKRALDNAQNEDATWLCPDCSKDFLVGREDKFLCLFCHWEEPHFSCERCSSPLPEHETFETQELFEWEFDEGRAIVVNDFEISERKVCEPCFDELQKEVEDVRRDLAILEAEEEYHYYMERALHKDPY